MAVFGASPLAQVDFQCRRYRPRMSVFGIVVLVISIAVNVALYSVGGAALWFLWSQYERLLR